jgi:Holliday junction resolvase
MRRSARVDANHAQIVAGLRQMGCSVLSLAPIGRGCPDMLVGWRGVNLLIEVKDGGKAPSRRELTPDEIEFLTGWNGTAVVVKTLQEAIDMVRQHTHNDGR